MKYQFVKSKHILVLIMLLSYPISLRASIQLMWQKSFKNPIIQVSEINELTEEYQKGPSFLIKAVMTTKNINFFNAKGQIDKTLAIKNYFNQRLSNDGHTIAILEEQKILISHADNKLIAEIPLIDKQSVVLPQHFYFELSPDGQSLVLVNWFLNTICFYHNDGKLIKIQQIDDLKKSIISFSKDSKYVLINIPNWEQNKQQGYFLLFTHKGEKLWSFEHQGRDAVSDISYSGKNIVIAANKNIFLLDKSGNIKLKKSLTDPISQLRISGDGNYSVYSALSDHSISLLDHSKNEILWTKKLKTFDSINSPFTSLEISDTASHIAVAVGKHWGERNTESLFFIYDRKSNMLFKQKISDSNIRAYMGKTGKNILFHTRKKAYLYQIK
ncbi:conserved hypothetical protein, secreted [Candidatus Magnetomorum sp. HK-1]|nr:conserved hypothetical protein, secreted [Candidatus Magnetomorum sp. HK-1]